MTRERVAQIVGELLGMAQSTGQDDPGKRFSHVDVDFTKPINLRSITQASGGAVQVGQPPHGRQ